MRPWRHAGTVVAKPRPLHAERISDRAWSDQKTNVVPTEFWTKASGIAAAMAWVAFQPVQ